MRFGENLREIRKCKKMSQEQLADMVNVTRQSVSKWKNGESYPEMNNILELCKIFNCKLNDLVHTDMSDIASLDEEVVMSVSKFNLKKQKEVKTLSNVIGMIGKIGSIVLRVAIPFVVIAMIIVPYIVSNVSVKDGEITFKTDGIKITNQNEIEIHGVLVGTIDEDVSKSEIIKMFVENSNNKIIIYMEVVMIFLLVDIIIMIIIFNYVEKLFDNIRNNKTPFTLDNVSFIKKISYLMISLIILTSVSEGIFDFMINSSSSEISFELVGILEILIIFSMSYIFEYGCEIQKDSHGKIYD